LLRPQKSVCYKILPKPEKSSAERFIFSKKSNEDGVSRAGLLQNFYISNMALNRPEGPFPAIFAFFLEKSSHTRTRALENRAFP